MTIRVRFAPSPTGKLHMGGARTALFNWLYARHHGGLFLLRIEDTDRERSTEASVQGILEGLDALGISPDEPPVFQSRNVERHVATARKLEEEGLAYRCYCTRERLDEMRSAQRARGDKPRYDRHCLNSTDHPDGHPYVLRFKVPQEGRTEVSDLIKGEVGVDNGELDDLIILRSDGSPTYNFAVVIDDYDMGITHIVRGDDHLNNTFRQVHIYKALGWETPQFGHLPLIKGLSKRMGSASVQDYEARGFLPEAILNYIARLGWAHGDDEIFSRTALIEKFDLGGVARSPANFDEQKLTWLNEHYIKESPDHLLAEQLLPFLHERGYEQAQTDERLLHLVRVLKPRSGNLVDMAGAAGFVYQRPGEYGEKAVKKWIKGQTFEIILEIVALLENLSPFTAETLEKAILGLAERHEIKLGKIAQPIRICLTGDSVSPPLYDTLLLVGQEESIERLNRGHDALKVLKESQAQANA